jgi:DNA-binding NarL/FixJ family response regulator
VCRLLDLAEPTVKNHVTAILKALGASNRTEAVVAASARGWELSTSQRASQRMGRRS